MSYSDILLVLTALFACQISNSNAETVPGPNFRKWRRTGIESNGENSFYLACKPQASGFLSKENCIVGFDKVTNFEEDHFCDFNLQVEEKDGYFSPINRIYVLGKGQAVIDLHVLGPNDSNRYQHIYIISPTDCKVANIKVYDTLFKNSRDIGFKVAVGSESFDIFFHNEKCGDKMCWMTISDEGKIVNGPIEYYEVKNRSFSTYNVQRLDRDVPQKGHLILEANKNGTDYYLRRPDGTEKLLAHSIENWWWGAVVSNNLIGTCYKTESATKCAQYDFDGKMKLEVDMDDLPKAIYNLPNGGFLFSSMENKLEYYVTKIGTDGLKRGSFICHGTEWNHKFYQNKEGKHCLMMPCEVNGGNAAVRCFNDAIFST